MFSSRKNAFAIFFCKMKHLEVDFVYAVMKETILFIAFKNPTRLSHHQYLPSAP